MSFTRMKVGNNFLILVVLFFLGYTHFLGGPYWLAKFLFILILVGTLFLMLFVWGMIGFIKKLFKKQMVDFDNNNNKITGESETIKVEATIVE